MSKIITQISVQQKNKNKCSVFLDEEFAFGLNQEVVFQYGLKKGDSLTEQQIDEILDSDKRKKAKERALNFLSYRDRSEHEMIKKLNDVGYDAAVVDWVINELKKLNLINDKRFAVNFIQNKMITHPMGEFLARKELSNKGIDSQLIDEIVEQIYREQDQFSIALKISYARRKRFKEIEDVKAKKRISDLLLRRGFNWNIISQVFEQWDDMIQENEN